MFKSLIQFALGWTVVYAIKKHFEDPRMILTEDVPMADIYLGDILTPTEAQRIKDAYDNRDA